jgi:hypothetical protein
MVAPGGGSHGNRGGRSRAAVGASRQAPLPRRQAGGDHQGAAEESPALRSWPAPGGQSFGKTKFEAHRRFRFRAGQQEHVGDARELVDSGLAARALLQVGDGCRSLVAGDDPEGEFRGALPDEPVVGRIRFGPGAHRLGLAAAMAPRPASSCDSGLMLAGNVSAIPSITG